MNKNAVVQIYSIPSGNHISDIIIFRKSGMGFPIEIHHIMVMGFHMEFGGFSSIFMARGPMIGPRLLEITRKQF